MTVVTVRRDEARRDALLGRRSRRHRSTTLPGGHDVSDDLLVPHLGVVIAEGLV
jgi:hypothetical protein